MNVPETPPPDQAAPSPPNPSPRTDHARRRLLDAASGPLHPTARDTLVAAVSGGWADPARLYSEGRIARSLLDRSRQVIAEGLGVRPTEVSLLPSGPVALTRAVEGVLHAARRRGGRTVASAVEHSAVLVPARGRAARAETPTPPFGPLLTEVPVGPTGAVDLDAWAGALAVPGTVVAALQHANPEVGTLQPLSAAHEHCVRAGVPLVVDATASLGRVAPPTDWDVLVGDARSWGGPPLGVLVVREGVRWSLPDARADIEHGRAPEAPWVPLALAAAEAWQQSAATRDGDAATARALVEDIRTAAAQVSDTEVLGDPVHRLPHVVTFSSLFVDGEAVVGGFDRAGFAVASGSACTSSTLEPSHVLAAMGVLTHGNVRVTLPWAAVSPSRAEDVALFCAALAPTIAGVREELGAAGL